MHWSRMAQGCTMGFWGKLQRQLSNQCTVGQAMENFETKYEICTMGFWAKLRCQLSAISSLWAKQWKILIKIWKLHDGILSKAPVSAISSGWTRLPWVHSDISFSNNMAITFTNWNTIFLSMMMNVFESFKLHMFWILVLTRSLMRTPTLPME